MSLRPNETYYHIHIVRGDRILTVKDFELSLKALREVAEHEGGHDLIGVPVEVWYRHGDDKREFGFFTGDTSDMVAEGWTRAI